MTIVGNSTHGYFPDGRIPRFQRIEGNRGELLKDYRYIAPNGDVLVAKAGLLFDGASIPRLFWGLSTNPWADDVIGPATIHDAYCQLGREGVSPIDSDAVHYNFHQGLRAIGVSAFRARARWLAVKTAGPKFKAVVVSIEPPKAA
jgi:hypothetical protein